MRRGPAMGTEPSTTSRSGHVHGRGDGPDVLDLEIDQSRAVGPRGGRRRRPHGRRRRRAGRSPAMRAAASADMSAAVWAPAPPAAIRLRCSSTTVPSITAVSPPMAAIAIWPRCLTVCGPSRTSRRHARGMVTGTATRTTRRPTTTRAPSLTSAGTGRPSATSTAAWSAIRSARVCARQTSNSGSIADGHEAGQARREHELDRRLPARIHCRITGVDEEISGAKPGTTLGTLRVTTIRPPDSDAVAPARIETRERGVRGVGGRPADQRRPRAGPGSRLGRGERPAGHRRLPGAQEHERQRGHERDHLDAGLRALSTVGPRHAAHRRRAPRHGTRRRRLRERHKSAATIGAG